MKTPIRVLVRDKGPHRALLLYYRCPFSGKEVSRSARTRDLREANRAAARWERELHDHPPAPTENAWDRFRARFEDEHLAKLSDASKASYGTALNHLERVSKPPSVESVTADVLSRFQGVLIEEGRPLTSVGNYLRHILAALGFARDLGMIQVVPRIKTPRLHKRTLMRGRPLTRVELRAMLRAAPTVRPADAARWQRLLRLLWLSGLRLGEALRLGWDSGAIAVNLDGLPYPHLVYWAEGHKSGCDTTTPIPPDFCRWLQLTTDRTGLVAGLDIATNQASRIISAIGAAAGVRVGDGFATAHDLRRSYGTRWAARVRPLTLQRLMRHAELSTTLRYYVGLSAADAGAELWGTSQRVVASGWRGRSTARTRRA